MIFQTFERLTTENLRCLVCERPVEYFNFRLDDLNERTFQVVVVCHEQLYTFFVPESVSVWYNTNQGDGFFRRFLQIRLDSLVKLEPEGRVKQVGKRLEGKPSKWTKIFSA